MTAHDDFAFEPIPGLPETPPAGEQILWQGAPNPRAFAIEVMRLKPIAIIALLLAGWRLAAGIHDGESAAALTSTLAWTLGSGVAVLALLYTAGHLMAKGTIYTLTSQRLVIRHGVAMPMAINVPFKQIAGAALAAPERAPLHALLGPATSSIALHMMPGSRASLIALWPHARPFKWIKPEPALRGLTDGPKVAHLVSSALVAYDRQASVTQTVVTQAVVTQTVVRPAASSKIGGTSRESEAA